MDYKNSHVIQNAKACIAILLIAQFAMPVARAEDTYAGISYGQLKAEDIETGNLGFFLGRSPGKGVGFEIFYDRLSPETIYPRIPSMRISPSMPTACSYITRLAPTTLTAT